MGVANGVNGTGEAGLVAARKAVVPNHLKRKIASGQLANVFTMKSFSSIEIVHYAAVAGYDGLMIDLEHGALGLESANNLCMAALQVGVTPFCRVPCIGSEWISRSLDGGAQCVVVPHVNTPEEAAEAVRYAKFQPLGERSATMGLPTLRYASVPAKYGNPVGNDETMVICMIETADAVRNAEAIASVEGVDMLKIGTNDLTADMGIPGDYDNPKLAEAYAAVSAGAAAGSKKKGSLVSVGIGGLKARLDLVETLVNKHDNIRYNSAAADGLTLLAGMKANAEKCLKVSNSLAQKA